jgi:Uncharacterised protein family UPF0547
VSPILIYSAILMVPLILAVALRYLIVVPRRGCPQCDRSVAVTAPKCRHCGYRFTAEDRRHMSALVARRKARFRSMG